MDRTIALGILQSLADGIHPATGQTMPAESPYQHPDVIRALFHAVGALRPASGSSAPGVQAAATETSGAAASAPTPAPVDALSSPAAPARRGAGNSGKPWTKDEDEQLVTAFDAGQPVAALAQAHGRSKVAIEARLAKFGRVPMPTGLRSVPRAEESRVKYAARA
jgi:hypothetical protein